MIGTLDTQEVEIWNGIEFEKTSVFNVAHSVQIITVTADTGQELQCSTTHMFTHQPNYIQDVLTSVQATELEPGMRLLKSPQFPVITSGTKVLPHAYSHGFYAGAEKYRRRRLVTSKAALFGGRRRILEHLELSTPAMDKANIYFLDTMPEDYEVPVEAGYSLETRLQWLAGFFDGGATMRKTRPKPIWYMYSESRDFLQQVKLLIQTLGGDARVVPTTALTQEPYSLRISGPAMQKLQELGIPVIDTPIPINTYTKRGLTSPKIASIEDSFRDSDVYNFVGTERKMAIFNGLYTQSN